MITLPPPRVLSREHAERIVDDSAVHSHFLVGDAEDIHFVHRTSHEGIGYNCFLTLRCMWFWMRHMLADDAVKPSDLEIMPSDLDIAFEVVFTDQIRGSTVTEPTLRAHLAEVFGPVCRGILQDLELLVDEAPRRPQQLSLF